MLKILRRHCSSGPRSTTFEPRRKKTGSDVIKLFSYSTQLSTKIILLINVKMRTIVGILTFISMINTTPKRLKARNFFICRYFSFMSSFKFTRYYEITPYIYIQELFLVYMKGIRSIILVSCK